MSQDQPWSTQGAAAGVPSPGGAPGGAPGSIPPPQAGWGGVDRGVLASLFDFSFEHLVTFRVLRFFYILGVVLGGLFLLALLLGALLGQSLTLLVSFVLGVGWFLLYLIGARIAAEFLVVVFRLGEDVRALRQTRVASPPPGGGRPTT